jgi:cell volume regulation protein A
MMHGALAQVDVAILAVAVVLLLGVLTSKLSDRYGVPSLLFFLALGMLAGSDGPGGIYFDDAAAARALGTVALVLILFFGGLSTVWVEVRPVLGQGIALATAGVFCTAVLTGLFARILPGFTIKEGLLLGAIVSSTDAAAVFSILRSRGVSLRGRLRPLIELESGSNDPMAVFLTVGMIGLLTGPDRSAGEMALGFVSQMSVGALVGVGIGLAAPRALNRMRLGYDGLYPVLTFALGFLAYGAAAAAGGNGFLAVYLAGITMGNSDFIHKRSLLGFHDGLAWLMQIAMFFVLGLLVFPSRLVPVIGEGLLVTAFIMLVARPVSVFACMAPSGFAPREKLFVSWVGLRGAVPIVLATYPLTARIPQSEIIFDVVFFVVIASVLFQGTSVAGVARRLGVDAPLRSERTHPLEYHQVRGMRGRLRDVQLLPGSCAVGKALVDARLPPGFLAVLIERGGQFVIPRGSTVLEQGDVLLVLAEDGPFNEGLERLEACEAPAAG